MKSKFAGAVDAILVEFMASTLSEREARVFDRLIGEIRRAAPAGTPVVLVAWPTAGQLSQPRGVETVLEETAGLIASSRW